MNQYNKQGSICWDCANATGKCSWSDSREYKPVEGWKAVRNDIKVANGVMAESYLVTECPEFKPDAERVRHGR